MAGKKARVLWRLHDGTAALTVQDEHDDVMVIVEPDGSMYEERICGLYGLGKDWDAAKPAEKMLVPDDAGRKRWNLDTAAAPPIRDGASSHPEPEPEPVRGMQPVPVAAGPDATNLADIEGRSWGPGVRWLG